MKKSTLLVSAGLIIAAACAPREGIEVRDAWARTAAQGGNGAVYFVIHNYSAEDDALTGVSTEVAADAEIHESSLAGDVMEMHMAHNVRLASGEDIEFSPGGLHVMLVNLQQDLEIGETIEITLHFENNPELTVSVDIKAGPEHDDD